MSRWSALVLFLAAIAACGDDDSPDAAPADAPVADGAAVDALVGPDGAEQLDQHGFPIRVPQVHSVPCTSAACPTPTIDLMDIDHVCTLVQGTLDAVIYVRAYPTGIDPLSMLMPVYATGPAWIFRGGVTSPLAGAVYDYGGNHHNESIQVTVDATTYTYWHSSFGVGYRACDEPDCLQIVGGEDGCTVARTLPIVCVEIQPDGSEPPLVDDFVPCQ